MFWKNRAVILGGPVLLALLLGVGLTLNLFHTTFWYDMLLHFLGGAVVVVSLGGAAWHLVSARKPELLPDAGPFRMLLIAGLLIAAALWELGEVLLNMTPNWTTSKADTIADIIYALIGAAVVLPFIRFRA